MPRLGGDEEAKRRLHTAYSARTTSFFGGGGAGFLLAKVLVVAGCFFVVRNLLFHDYRSDVIEELKARGKTEEEIFERFVPKTLEERRRYVADRGNDLAKMKDDIAFLLNEVHELRAKVDEGGAGGKNSTTVAKKEAADARR